MNLGLKDKTALVTGGSKGIGKAIAVAFAKEGTNVVICGRGEAALKEAAAETSGLLCNRPLQINRYTRK